MCIRDRPGPAAAAGRELAAGVRHAVAADTGGQGVSPIPPMPVRPVPDEDDDTLVRRAVAASPPGMEG
eukprot:15477869-Alexandrium_andersonii.AAC.1